MIVRQTLQSSACRHDTHDQTRMRELLVTCNNVHGAERFLQAHLQCMWASLVLYVKSDYKQPVRTVLVPPTGLLCQILSLP